MAEGRGIIVPLVIGVAALVISVIVALVIVSNVADVETDIADPINQITVNESCGIGNTSATGCTVSKASSIGFSNAVLIAVINSTSYLKIENANFTMNAATGLITNTTAGENNTDGDSDAFLITYSYDSKPTTISTSNMRGNFTAGIDNVSSKVPTILLIAAVVIVLAILVLLWQRYKFGIGDVGGL